MSLKITSSCLLTFKSLEQTLEISSSKAVKVVALDDFDEHRGPVEHMFGKNLEQISLLVKVNQNMKLFQNGNILFECQSGV